MSSAPVRLAVAGALGRMGKAVTLMGGSRVTARFDRPGAEGEGLVGMEAALDLCDAVIDFTTPAASAALAERMAVRGRGALVIGSTGFGPAEAARVRDAARRIAIVKSGNFSLGVNMLMGLVRQAAAQLPAEDFDIEVFEAHHRRKVDAPSGTALMLGEAAAQGRGIRLDDHAERARDGLTGPRREGVIGFSVQRGGGIIGEHSVTFASDEELLVLSHSARDRSLFARGAIRAAEWAVARPPGLYDMQDVLGFSAAREPL